MALVLTCVEVDGVWLQQTAWTSTFVCADVPASCCESVLSFGWNSVCVEGPGCGCVSPEVLTAEELALASLEVEGPEPGSPVEIPEAALL